MLNSNHSKISVGYDLQDECWNIVIKHEFNLGVS